MGSITAVAILILMSFSSSVYAQTTKFEISNSRITKTFQQKEISFLGGLLLGFILFPIVCIIFLMVFMKLIFGTQWLEVFRLILTSDFEWEPGIIILAIGVLCFAVYFLIIDYLKSGGFYPL
jgi:hypothetical protein